MKPSRSKIRALPGVLAGLFLLSPDARAESLEEAVLAALNNHPSVEAALASRDAAIESQEEQFSGYFPRLRVNAATGRVYGDNATSRGLSVDRGAGYSWMHEGGVTLTQVLFDGFRVRNRIDAAAARRMAASEQIVDLREELALQTALAYLSVLRAHEEKEIISAYAAQVDDYIDRIRTMVDGGAANEAELHQAEDMRILLENIRLESEGRLEVAGVRYAELVGNYPQGGLALPAINESLIPEEAVAVSDAMENHPALGISKWRAEAAENEIAVEKGALYPEFNAEMSYYKKDLDDIIGGEVVDARGLIRMSWNFATGGEQFDKIDRRRHEYLSQQARVNETRRQIEREIRTAFAELDTAGRQNETYVRRVILMNNLAKTNRTQFEGGLASLLQLLQSENQLFSAKLDQIGAKYRLLAAHFGVLAGMGKLQSSLNIVPASDDHTENDKEAATPAAGASAG
ncbi:MAG: transporter [Alphaproteobacteria bacterium]|nr:transporter [Alphaproteobacteria bacterium]